MAGGPHFPTTDWAMLSRVTGDQDAHAQKALQASIERYLPSIREYLRLDRRVRTQDVEDLAHAFIADRVIGYRLFSKADRARGRFRNLLATALHHYVISSNRSTRSGTQAPGQALSLSPELPEPVAAGIDPARAFDMLWARQTLTHCLVRTRTHYEKAGMLKHWIAFERRLVAPAADGVEPPSFKELVTELGFDTPSQASNAVINVRRYFLKQLEAVLLEQSEAGANFRDEVAELMKILSLSAGSGPRLRK